MCCCHSASTIHACNCPLLADQPQAPYSVWSTNDIFLGEYSAVDQIVTPTNAFLAENSSAVYVYVGEQVDVDYKVTVGGGFIFLPNENDCSFPQNYRPVARVCRQAAPPPPPLCRAPTITTTVALETRPDLTIWQRTTESCGLATDPTRDRTWRDVVVGRESVLRLRAEGEYAFRSLLAQEDSVILIDLGVNPNAGADRVVDILVSQDLVLEERVQIQRAIGSEDVQVNLIQYNDGGNYHTRINNAPKNRQRTQRFNICANSPVGLTTIGNRIRLEGTVVSQNVIHIGNYVDIRTPEAARRFSMAFRTFVNDCQKAKVL
jgi:hypothetical protein